MKRIMLLAAVCFTALSATALAQGDFWMQRPIDGGCTVAVPAANPAPPDTVYRWDGACVSGAGVSGRGTMSLTFRVANAPDPVTATATGEWVNGFPNGRFQMDVRDAQGRVMRESEIIYNMGCAADGRDPGCPPGNAN